MEQNSEKGTEMDIQETIREFLLGKTEIKAHSFPLPGNDEKGERK